jgi:hypothetical protein
MNETFDKFEYNSQIGPVGMSQSIIMGDAKDDEPFIDYSSFTIEEIISKFPFTIIPKEDITPNFSQVYVHNKYTKLYLAKTNKFGPCSLLILNEVDSKKMTFANLLTKLSFVNDLNCKGLLKIKAISIVNRAVWFLYDPIMNTLKNSKKTKSNTDLNPKFSVLFYLIEMVHYLHDKRNSIMELRPSNVLLNSHDEFRYLIPYRKMIFIFR